MKLPLLVAAEYDRWRDCFVLERRDSEIEVVEFSSLNASGGSKQTR